MARGGNRTDVPVTAGARKLHDILRSLPEDAEVSLEQLRTAVERVVAGGGEELIQIEHILPVLQLHRAHSPFVPSGNLREARQRFERDYIASVLQHYEWRMAPAAQALGIQRPNLYRKARQLGIPLVRVSE